MLTLYVTDATVDPLENEFKDKDFVRLSDLLTLTLFRHAPKEFFEQYSNGTLIGDIHWDENFLKAATEFLVKKKEKSLTLIGHMKAQRLTDLIRSAQQHKFPLDVKRLSHAATLRTLPLSESSKKLTSKQITTALKSHGVQDYPARFWAKWLRSFIYEEALTTLHIKKDEAFYRFLKILTGKLGTRLNWALIARETELSIPTVQLWCEFLSRYGLIDLLSAQKGKTPRRVLQRPLLFFTSLSFPLWFSRTSMENPDERKRYVLNALYLMRRNASLDSTFTTFEDTNHYEAPFIETIEDQKKAFYIIENEEDEKNAVRFTRSLIKAGYITSALFVYNGALVKTPLVDMEGLECATIVDF